MPTDEAQQLEDLTVANETLREENERLREALVAILNHGDTHEYPCHALHQGDCADTMREYARTALWTPTANAADPETF